MEYKFKSKGNPKRVRYKIYLCVMLKVLVIYDIYGNFKKLLAFCWEMVFFLFQQPLGKL